MRTIRTFSSALAGLLLVLVAASPALAQGADDDRAQPQRGLVADEILVKFRKNTPPGQVLRAANAVGAKHLRSFAPLRIRHWRLGKGITVGKALQILANPGHARFVEYAEPNYVWRANETPDDPQLGALWGMHNVGQTGGTADADIDAPEAWDVEKGSGAIVVGVIDSGVDYLHEDLAANIWTNPGEIAGNGIDDDGNGYVDDVRGWDFVNDDNDPMDDHGHGTHVSGTIGAVGGNGVGVVGVNWNVSILPLKFLNAGGSGTTDNAIAALLYAASFEDAQGGKIVRITSNSWGGGRRSKALQDAIENSGALFVAAAGNAATSRKMYPAGYGLPNMVSVAATDADDQLASFSNYGPDWVDLAAPGVDTLSTQPGNAYGTKSGTSMACPHVAGAAALLMAHFPNDDNAATKARLLDSVDPLAALADRVGSGGRLNAARALGVAPPAPGGDTAPPDAIADLAVDAAAVTYNSITLGWTATGDDGGSGTAWVYDLRYLADTPITEANWDSATPADGEPQPQAAGAAEGFVLTGLASSTTYFVALKVFDEAGNASALSNVASATTTAPPTGSWLTETVDADGDVGFYNAVDFDADGNPGIGYSHEGNDQVKVAVWNGTSWDTEVVDSDSPGVDFAFAPDGTPSLSYGWGRLNYARKVGGSWQIDVIEKSNARNDVTSLDYDPATGEPAISYHKTGGNGVGLKLARRVGGTWQTAMVDAGAGARYSSLAFDPATGHPMIAYSDDVAGDGWLDTLKVARWDGSAWQVDILETGVVGYGVFASIAVDPTTGRPAVVHRADGNIRFLRWNGTAWEAPVVVAPGTGCSLAYDAAGTPFVGFTRYEDRTTRLAFHDGTAWTVELVDTVAEWRSAVAVDPGGNPALGYSDGAADDLKFAHK